MVKNRIRKKAHKKRRSAGAVNKAKVAVGVKRKLTMQEHLDRVPNREILTTQDVRYIFNNCVAQTIYKMVKRSELISYRTRNRGRSSVYKRKEVLASIRARFQLVPVSSDSTVKNGGIDDCNKKKGN